MSASLVGSEMCIRDRQQPRIVAPCRRSTALSQHRIATALRCCSTMASVSYTHLTLPTICSV
eukprot:12247000-Alexandrium_andersonii.AAC.1